MDDPNTTITWVPRSRPVNANGLYRGCSLWLDELENDDGDRYFVVKVCGPGQNIHGARGLNSLKAEWRTASAETGDAEARALVDTMIAHDLGIRKS
jgi:hypothetical protein